MSCSSITTIQPTECIGNSLVTINNNFNILSNDVCDVDTQINDSVRGNDALYTLFNNVSSSAKDQFHNLTNQYNGIATCWVLFNGTQTTDSNQIISTTTSYNVSTLYKTDTGKYSLIFSNFGLITTSNYAIVASSSLSPAGNATVVVVDYNGKITGNSSSNSGFNFVVQDVKTNTYVDVSNISLAVYGT